MFRYIATAFVVLSIASSAKSDWPQFRGPDGQGRSTAQRLPITWSPTENIVWHVPIPGNGWSSPVILDGQIWLTTALEEGKSRHSINRTVKSSGVATCLDTKTGDAIWTERMGGNYAASPVHAEGHIFFASEEGRVTVIKTGPDYVELASNQLDGQRMASPAISGRAMFFRTDTQLVRIEKTRPATTQGVAD